MRLDIARPTRHATPLEPTTGVYWVVLAVNVNIINGSLASSNRVECTMLYKVFMEYEGNLTYCDSAATFINCFLKKAPGSTKEFFLTCETATIFKDCVLERRANQRAECTMLYKITSILTYFVLSVCCACSLSPLHSRVLLACIVMCEFRKTRSVSRHYE